MNVVIIGKYQRLKTSVLSYETAYSSAFHTKDYANANKAEKHLIEAQKELKAHEVSKPKGGSKTEDLASSKASAQFWLRVILLISGFLFVGRVDRKG